MHVVVLGAGLAGLSAAYELARAGERVTVLEKEAHVGGLAHSWKRGEFWLDLGPHRFYSKNEALIDHLYDLLDGEVVVRERRSRIHMLGRYFDYPLQATNVVTNLPKTLLARALWDYAAVRMKQRFVDLPERDFESWVVKRFGRTLYEVFFGTYTSKAWGIPCSRISSDWAAQRIAQANLWDVIAKTLRPPRNGEVRSLANEFYYPAQGGIGAIARAYAADIERNGGDVRLCAPTVRLERNGARDGRIRRVVWERDGVERALTCDAVVSTIPLPNLARAVDPALEEGARAAANALDHVAIVFVYLEIDRPFLSKDHWIYLPEKHLAVHRVSEFKNFCDASAPGDRTAVCCEITCRFGDATWNMPHAELARIAERDLVTAGLVDAGHARLVDVARARHAYPVYDLEYEPRVEALRDAIDDVPNLWTTGRQGLFRYNNMDHSILMGRKTARQVLADSEQRVDEVALAAEYFG